MSSGLAMARAPALQPWNLIAAGVATVMEAKLSSAASFLPLFFSCVIASSSYLAMDSYTGLRPREGAVPGRFQAWTAGHTDQVIIWGTLLPGVWLNAKSPYLVLS